MGLLHLSTFLDPEAHYHHLQALPLVILTAGHHHHPTSLGQEVHIPLTTLGNLDHCLTSQESLLTMMVEVLISQGLSNPRYKQPHTITETIRDPHMDLPLGDLHQTTLMDEEAHLVLQEIFQGTDFLIQPNFVVHLRIEYPLKNREEGHPKIWKDTGVLPLSISEGQELHCQDTTLIMILEVRQHVTSSMTI